ncbi:MAG TPA: hypothetical protein VFD49_00645 [Candidatus Dormibacteraeota bacterium]|nr:hypothetical protein [Candidatus Dormibacteraeota bacterium]
MIGQMVLAGCLVAAGIGWGVRRWVHRAPVPPTALRCLQCPVLARRVRWMWVSLMASWLFAVGLMVAEYRLLRGR